MSAIDSENPDIQALAESQPGDIAVALRDMDVDDVWTRQLQTSST